MEIEKDNPLPFLDTTVARDSDGLLNTTVYRKPTHTDHYLAYDSFLSQWSVVLLSVCTAELNTSQRNRQLFKFMTVLLYIKGVSEVLRRCLQHQGIRTVFKSETTLRFHFKCHLETTRTNETKRCRLQDPLWMQQGVYRWNREINARKG